MPPGAAAGLVAAVTPSFAKPKAPKQKPSVLYVFDDERRFQFMPGKPFSDSVVAPDLDAFRKANVSMDRCTSNYLLCSPYRGDDGPVAVSEWRYPILD